ncbi:MAG: HAD hydrolase-like protein, partial [Bdellovibrionales bacterium]
MTKAEENLIFFDWNGTLLSDATACLRCMNVVLKKLGVSPITRAQYQKHYTMPLDRLYHAVGVTPDVLLKNEHIIHPLYHEAYGAEKVRLRRGAKTMLHALQKNTCKSVILSNYVAVLIEKQAERLGVREHFDDVLAFHAYDDTFRKRGKGERLKDYLKARPARAGIIVGDTEEEVEIGRDIGLVTIAITD